MQRCFFGKVFAKAVFLQVDEQWFHSFLRNLSTANKQAQKPVPASIAQLLASADFGHPHTSFFLLKVYHPVKMLSKGRAELFGLLGNGKVCLRKGFCARIEKRTRHRFRLCISGRI
jgi:hypothetical protein